MSVARARSNSLIDADIDFNAFLLSSVVVGKTRHCGSNGGGGTIIELSLSLLLFWS